MLSQLYIQNIAVIERTSIEFGPGLNILTGETGAGKSILIDAINAVLGFRTSRDLIRTGADRAVVTALFDNLSPQTRTVLEENGYEPEEDGTLLLSRELSAEGKTVCKIGGRPVTVSILREVASTLIDIHGQHNNQALMTPEQHIGFIDGYAGTESLLARYREEYARMQQVRHALEKLDMDETEKSYRVDLLTYQTEEIAAAGLRSGEEEELNAQRKRIQNAAKIAESIEQAGHALDGAEDSDGAVVGLDMAREAVLTASSFFEELAPMAQRLEEIYYEVREYASDIVRYAEELEFDPDDGDRIEQRLDIIYKMKRKYGETVEEILAFYSKALSEMESITNSEEEQRKLRLDLEKRTGSAQKLAKELSAKRLAAAKRLAVAVKEELRFLDMPFVTLEVRGDTGGLASGGIDQMEFMISANAGEPPKPLARIASGGELSRIMLSLKNVLADKDRIGTLIFDEVDSGVSGRAAQKIGQKLLQVSRGRQIICVTHLAQVACYADHHLLIEKDVRGNRTFTEVRALDKAQRVEEIARIMGGSDLTETVLKGAAEMLQRAHLGD